MYRQAAAPDDSAAEVEVLRGRLTDAATKNKKLLALVHQQHSQIQVTCVGALDRVMCRRLST